MFPQGETKPCWKNVHIQFNYICLIKITKSLWLVTKLLEIYSYQFGCLSMILCCHVFFHRAYKECLSRPDGRLILFNIPTILQRLIITLPFFQRSAWILPCLISCVSFFLNSNALPKNLKDKLSLCNLESFPLFQGSSQNYNCRFTICKRIRSRHNIISIVIYCNSLGPFLGY